MSKIFTKSSDADAIKMAVRSLRKEARSWFSEMSADGHDAGDAMASAWYHVTYHPDYWGRCNGGTDRPHLISFPWFLRIGLKIFTALLLRQHVDLC
ncbi:hypothetical protein EJB05_39039, partial [Eragrostis curvula]